MIQGAGSNVGKSLIVAGLCRVFARRGLAVRPFKPQNMSNNAAATHTGGEIGRAQALQALAAGVAPSIDMNPVLLKPESETGAQIIVLGRRWGTMRAREFGQRKAELLPAVLESYKRLARQADLVIVEGAGSPAEVNLRAGDIANMGFAEAACLPVVLVGDIERGGVIASLVGTHVVLSQQDRARIKAFAINKFRGDVSLFDGGVRVICEKTGWQPLGVMPYFSDAGKLPAEDILDIARPAGRRCGCGASAVGSAPAETLKIAVPVAGRIANFDDLDPLRLEPNVALELVHPGRPLPLDADLILLPGSKATIADLAILRAQGWDIDIAAHIRRGGHVLGLCGGYQMLGQTIADPDGVEGKVETVRGLGFLDVETLLTGDKIVRPVEGRHPASGTALAGYEIHIGRTTGPDTRRALFEIAGQPAGATSANGRVMGTYVHGIFGSDTFRRAFLAALGCDIGGEIAYLEAVEAALDGFADHLEKHLDCDAIWRIACNGSDGPSAIR